MNEVEAWCVKTNGKDNQLLLDTVSTDKLEVSVTASQIWAAEVKVVKVSIKEIEDE